jgi:hypothetical protein
LITTTTSSASKEKKKTKEGLFTLRACENPDWYTEFLAISHKSQELSFHS